MADHPSAQRIALLAATAALGFALYRILAPARRAREPQPLDALIDTASSDSFPASDPPSWTPTSAGAPQAVE